MNDTQNTQDTSTNEPATERSDFDAASSKVIGAVVDVGAAWAECGLGLGRIALENSARALGRTAKLLETLQEQFKRGGDAPSV